MEFWREMEIIENFDKIKLSVIMIRYAYQIIDLFLDIPRISQELASLYLSENRGLEIEQSRIDYSSPKFNISLILKYAAVNFLI